MSRRSPSVPPEPVNLIAPSVSVESPADPKAPRRTLSTRLAERGLHHAAALALLVESDPSFTEQVRDALAAEDAANALKVKAGMLAARALNVEAEVNAAVEKAAKSRPVLDRLDAAAKKIAEIRAS